MQFISNAKYNTPVESGTIYRAKINNLDVVIHGIHGLDGWFLSCPVFKIDDYRLKSESLFAAIKESRDIIREKGIILNDAVLKYCTDEPTELVRH